MFDRTTAKCVEMTKGRDKKGMMIASLFSPLEYAKAFDALQHGVKLKKYSKNSAQEQERVFSMHFHHEEESHRFALKYPRNVSEFRAHECSCFRPFG